LEDFAKGSLGQSGNGRYTLKGFNKGGLSWHHKSKVHSRGLAKEGKDGK